MSSSLQVNSEPRHISYRWVIDDISNKLTDNSVEYPFFSSSKFTSSPTDLSPSPSHFHLRLYPKGVMNGAVEDFLSVGLAFVSIDEQHKCVTRYELSLIDSDGHKQNSKELSYCFSSTKPCSVIGRFVSKSNLLNPETKFIQNDKLIIDCQITILSERSSFGYFCTLSFIAQSNPDLMLELLHDLAHNNRQHEFPDCVPLLNLPFDASLEETVTHHAKLSHSFESPISGGESVKMSFRKFGFLEVKSLSTEQTLLDLKLMLDSGKYCDVALLVEGKQFNTCKAILAAQSSVFEAMFNHDMKDKFESQLFLSDVTAGGFELFLNYLCTGKVASSSVNLKIMQLFEIADKFAVLLLKQQCEHILCNQVTIENVIELFYFSEQHSLDRLKQTCLKFITDHCFKVSENNSWKVEIEPTLFENELALSLTNRRNELPDFVPLDLPFDALLEETMTHRSVKFSLTFESPILKDKFGSNGTYFYFACVDTNPALKFKLKWVFHSSKSNECALALYYGSYSSTTNIFVDLSVTGMDNFSRIRSRDGIILNKDIPSEISLNSSPIYSFFRLNPGSPKDIDICLKMTIYKESYRKSGFSQLKSLSLQQILLDLKSMLKSGKHCDVVLLTMVDGKQFSAHKCILAAQSPVFEVMFSHDMKDKFESQLFLSDVTAEGFELFMNYLCTGKVVSSLAYLKVMQLFEIADKYIVLLLKQQCDHILCNQVTAESAIELLQFSERYSLGKLKQICLNFITDHCLEVTNNDSWKIASKIGPTLLVDMFCGLALNNRHNEFPDCVPLDFPFNASLEEATTHHAVFRHTSELTFSKSSSLDGLVEYNSHYVLTSPGLEFRVNWTFQEALKANVNVEPLSISYQSTPDIFVHYSVKCMTNCKVTGRRLCLLHKRLSNEFSHHDDDSSEEKNSISIAIANYWRKHFRENIGSIDRFIDQDVDVSLKMAIHMALSRTSGFHELMSLSRQQTLVDLKFILECGKYCDVALLVGCKQFSASKAILAAQSSIFEAMFCHDSKIESQISLSDVTADVFELFLNHLYSGKFPRQLTIKIVFELLRISERHFTVQLTQICIKFIVDHCLEVIHKDYLEIFAKSMPKLMMQIVEQLALKYQLNEFPDRVPLDLPTTHISLEETLTHNAKSSLSFETLISLLNYSHIFFPEMKSLWRQQLLMDLKSMLEDGKHCDVVLLVEGKQFSAHKTILVNRSNVFEAMFRYDMKEKIENRVEMDDVKIEVVEQFLLYLYTGKVDLQILEKYSMDLFVLADMHYLTTLSQMCLRMFGQSLTSESVAEQFELADRVGLTEFKQVCTDYMNKTN